MSTSSSNTAERGAPPWKFCSASCFWSARAFISTPNFFNLPWHKYIFPYTVPVRHAMILILRRTKKIILLRQFMRFEVVLVPWKSERRWTELCLHICLIVQNLTNFNLLLVLCHIHCHISILLWRIWRERTVQEGPHSFRREVNSLQVNTCVNV